MKAWVFLLAASMFLAGCSGDEEVDPTAGCDMELNYIDEGVCTPHVEPTMVVEGIPDSLEQFSSVELSWSLDNGTRTAVHSMDSRILASMEDMEVTNATGPDEWGTQIHKETHKDFPYSSTAQLSWDEVGTLYLKGYMEINAVNVWVDLGTVEITEVGVTGNRTTIAISGTPPSVDDNEVGITVGDGVTFDNQLQYEMTVTWSCTEQTPADGSIAAGETLDVDFTELTSCTYTLNTPLAVTGNDPGEVTGKVVVGRP